VHSVEVLDSTRSPALNTGPLPAMRLRTVRRTIRPSSAIQRRCQAPAKKIATTTTIPVQKTGSDHRRIRSGATSVIVAPRSEGRDDVDTDHHGQDPQRGQDLQDTVTEGDVLGLAGMDRAGGQG